MRKQFLVALVAAYVGLLYPMQPQTSSFANQIGQFNDQAAIVADKTNSPTDIQAALEQMQSILTTMDKNKAGGQTGDAFTHILRPFQYKLPNWARGADAPKSPAVFHRGKDPFREFQALIAYTQKKLARESTGVKKALVTTKEAKAAVEAELSKTQEEFVLLQEIIEDLSRKVDARESEASKLRRDFKASRSNNTKLETQIEKLQADFEKSKKKIATLAQQAADEKAARETFEAACKEATEAKACALKEASAAKKTIKTLQAKIAEETHVIDKLYAQQDVLEKALAQEKKEKIELLAQLDHLKFSLEKRQEGIKSLQQQLTTKEQQEEWFSSRFLADQKELATAQANLSQLTKEIEEGYKTRLSADEEIISLTNKVDDLAAREEELKTRVDIERGEFEEAYTALDKQFQQARDALSEIKTESIEKEKATEKQIDELRTKLDQAIKKASQTGKKAGKKAKTAAAQTEAIKQENIALKNQAEALEKAIDAFREKIAILQVQAEQTKKAEAEKDKLQGEIGALKKELEARNAEAKDFISMLGEEDKAHAEAVQALQGKLAFTDETLKQTQEQVDKALADRKIAMTKCEEEQACRISEQKLYEQELAVAQDRVKAQQLEVDSLIDQLEKMGKEKPGVWAKLKEAVTPKK